MWGICGWFERVESRQRQPIILLFYAPQLHGSGAVRLWGFGGKPALLWGEASRWSHRGGPVRISDRTEFVIGGQKTYVSFRATSREHGASLLCGWHRGCLPLLIWCKGGTLWPPSSWDSGLSVSIWDRCAHRTHQIQEPASLNEFLKPYYLSDSRFKPRC